MATTSSTSFGRPARIQGGGRGRRPERATHLDAGLDYQLTLDTRVRATGYLRAEREVLWTPGSEPRRLDDGAVLPGSIDAAWVNGLTGRARGVEVVLRREAPDGLSGWAGYAYSRQRYASGSPAGTTEHFAADADQRHTLSLQGNYRLSSRATLSAKFRYGSNYPLRGYIGGRIRLGRPAFYQLSNVRNSVRLRRTRGSTCEPIAPSTGQEAALSRSSRWRTCSTARTCAARRLASTGPGACSARPSV